MASIKRQPSGRWQARYRDDAGREHAQRFARKVDAQRWLDEAAASLVTGQYVDPRAGRMTVREYAAMWQSRQVWRPKTAKRVETDLRVHILPVFGDRPLSSVRRSDMQALVKQLATVLAPSSVKVTFSTPRGLFKAAVEDRLITASPCAGVKLPTVAPKALLIPSVETVRTIGSTLPGRYAAVVYVAAGLGLRPGEVFGLRVADVDFLRRVVSVRWQLDDHGAMVDLKTTASYRTIPLPDVVGVELARHLAAYPSTGLVFTGNAGQPVKRNTFSKTWRRRATTAGVPDLTLHDLRHVYASALIAAGESVKVVQKRMGHSSAAMTLDVYSHLWPDSDDRSRTIIDAFLGFPADTVRTVEA